MNTYRLLFGKKRRFFPVIHVLDAEQAIRNATIAQCAAADGIFMIDHLAEMRHLLAVYQRVRAAFPDLWIGLNFLDRKAVDAVLAVPEGAQGLWSDNAMINPSGFSTQAVKIVRHRANRAWPMIYFGGVAFKYQPKVTHPAQAAAAAITLVDVITTSGPGTGQPPDLMKIRSMREAVGDYPLAIASGMTAKNIGDFLPLVDCFLVATGISRSDYALDPALTTEMSRAIHA